jgi:UDP:flavonoid glycosyltransferase YjiC (YdhE family)
VIANRYFATPAIERQANVHKVGLVHYCKARDGKRLNKLPTRVLIGLGSAQAANGVADKLARAVDLMQEMGMSVFTSLSLSEKLAARCPQIQTFDFWNDDFDAIDLAVIRGGLGTVSDCIAAKIQMIYVDDPNPEIKFNQARLEELGIGLPLDRCLDEGREIFTNPFVYTRMLSKMSGFSLRGHVEATDALAKLWALRSNKMSSNYA